MADKKQEFFSDDSIYRNFLSVTFYKFQFKSGGFGQSFWYRSKRIAEIES
jgi:hypothetical protein